MSGEQAGRKRSYADMPQSNFEVYRRGATSTMLMVRRMSRVVPPRR